MSFFVPNWASALSLLVADDPGGRRSPEHISRCGELGSTAGQIVRLYLHLLRAQQHGTLRCKKRHPYPS